ncbi:hypothetical protein SLEP1_g60006 [Rubroshorea leprosula]|uniref:Uncharacterized protein n=1 Tax=Rubroshorea leprosula TaxID=152421 RepID=A0AAV5MUI2_9ROSI|nr:hypothetical protein SLEP1_g60006 [Rubroshorea leprosula]
MLLFFSEVFLHGTCEFCTFCNLLHTHLDHFYSNLKVYRKTEVDHEDESLRVTDYMKL